MIAHPICCIRQYLHRSSIALLVVGLLAFQHQKWYLRLKWKNNVDSSHVNEASATFAVSLSYYFTSITACVGDKAFSSGYYDKKKHSSFNCLWKHVFIIFYLVYILIIWTRQYAAFQRRAALFRVLWRWSLTCM